MLEPKDSYTISWSSVPDFERMSFRVSGRGVVSNELANCSTGLR